MKKGEDEQRFIITSDLFIVEDKKYIYPLLIKLIRVCKEAQFY